VCVCACVCVCVRVCMCLCVQLCVYVCVHVNFACKAHARPQICITTPAMTYLCTQAAAHAAPRRHWAPSIPEQPPPTHSCTCTNTHVLMWVHTTSCGRSVSHPRTPPGQLHAIAPRRHWAPSIPEQPPPTHSTVVRS
jgi:hypothetical protein